MNNRKKFQGLSRRRFISQVIPACSLVCLGASSKLWGISPGVKKVMQEAKHKFDEEFPRRFTYRQVMDLQFGRGYIPFLKFLSEEIGEEKVILISKKHAAVRGEEIGAMMAKQYGDNGFPTLKKIFNPSNPNYKVALTIGISEDTDKVYELKVTECIWAEVFLRADAGDLGFASICHGDYAMATGFNSKIKMVRDKTLMQGHSYCNHRYLLG